MDSIVDAEERLRTASNEMVLNQDDLDMVMLREALGGEVPQEPVPLPLEDQKTTPPPGLSNIFRGITSFFGHQPAYPLPGDLQDFPRMDMDLEAEMSSHFAIEDRFPEHFKDAAPPDPGQQRRDERAALSMRSAQMDKDDALARKQALCSHVDTTTSGSNAYYFRKSCKDYFIDIIKGTTTSVPWNHQCLQHRHDDVHL